MDIRTIFRKLAHPRHELFIPINNFFKSRKRLILICIGIFAFIFKFKSILLLIALGLIVMGWDYILHSTHFPIHMDILFFASIIVTRGYGFETALIFALISGNLPEIITGSFDVTDMLSTVPVIILCYISSSFSSISIVFLGIILSVIFAIAEFFIALFLAEPPHKVIFEPLVVLLLNLFLFLSLANTIMTLLKV